MNFCNVKPSYSYKYHLKQIRSTMQLKRINAEEAQIAGQDLEGGVKDISRRGQKIYTENNDKNCPGSELLIKFQSVFKPTVK